MSGRIGLPGGVQDLEQMRKSGAARNAGTHHQVKLTDNSRGRVNIGTTTLLFQFVVPPAVQPRPQLPAAARAGFVRSIDWMFTALVVFTFMSMFGFIVYLENADWPLAQDAAEVPLEVARLIFEEPTPPPEVDDAPTEVLEGEEEAEAPAKKDEPGPPREAPGPPSESDAKAQAEATARIAEEAAQAAEALIVGALSAEAGGALADVLAGGAVTGNAQDILAQAAGVGVAQSAAGGALRQRTGGGTGSGQQGLGSLQRAGGSETTAGRSEGTVVKEREIKGNLKLGDGDAIGGAGDFDANLVVQKIRSRLGGIRACYERELRKNPTLAGKVTIEFAIEERGNVSGVKVAENTTGDAAVGECVANEIKRIPTFNPGPEGGKVLFSYPFVFAPQQ
jgi:outer membrane biosynthesis protein TonB